MVEVRVTEGRLVPPSSESEISTVLVEPDDAIALMMLGHGSGTPIYRPVMVQMAEALADQRIATFRYNYPYSEGMTTYSPDKIDSLEVLLSTTNLAKSAVADMLLELPLFLGGLSMSSQVVSLALTREHWPDVRGVVLYVFPMGWHNLLVNPFNHLHRVPVPMLFVQGSRDEDFTDLRELQPVLDELGNRATLHVIEGADHFYDYRPGRTERGWTRYRRLLWRRPRGPACSWNKDRSTENAVSMDLSEFSGRFQRANWGRSECRDTSGVVVDIRIKASDSADV